MEDIKKIVSDILHTNIIDLLEMNDWPEKDKIVYMKKITEMIVNKTIIQMVEKLSGDEIEEYKRLSDESDEKGWEYLNTKVPDIKTMAAAEAAKVQIELKNDLDMFKNVMNSKKEENRQ